MCTAAAAAAAAAARLPSSSSSSFRKPTECMKNDDIQLKEENKETPCFLESLQLALWVVKFPMDAYKIR